MNEFLKHRGVTLPDLHASAASVAKLVTAGDSSAEEKLTGAFYLLLGIAKNHGYTEALTILRQEIVPLLPKSDQARNITPEHSALAANANSIVLKVSESA